MKITELNIIGEFKSRTTSGGIKVYKKNDVVYLDGETFVASRTIEGKSPIMGESTGWISLSSTQVFYESNNQPVYAKAGDEWFNTSTGIRYKRVSDDNGKHWVEI
jgi:hypothetical protein|tara:strand:+ start:22159 stop:22473 length:315 start_codon:yes stop_codon:yes gene_type:complete